MIVETEGQRGYRLALELDELTMQIREQEELIREVEQEPDDKELLPYMNRELVSLKRYRDRVWSQIVTGED